MGPSGDSTRFNVKRLREERGMSFASLARRLDAIGRPIPTLGLRKIESGERRVDVDDLVALAIALDVNINALVLQPVESDDAWLSLTGSPQTRSRHAWRWARGVQPLTYRPTSIPAGMLDAEGRPIAERTMEFAIAVFEAREDAIRLENVAFEESIDPALYQGEKPPHVGTWPPPTDEHDG